MYDVKVQIREFNKESKEKFLNNFKKDYKENKSEAFVRFFSDEKNRRYAILKYNSDSETPINSYDKISLYDILSEVDDNINKFIQKIRIIRYTLYLNAISNGLLDESECKIILHGDDKIFFKTHEKYNKCHGKKTLATIITNFTIEIFGTDDFITNFLNKDINYIIFNMLYDEKIVRTMHADECRVMCTNFKSPAFLCGLIEDVIMTKITTAKYYPFNPNCYSYTTEKVMKISNNHLQIFERDIEIDRKNIDGILYVYSGRIICQRNNHNIISASASFLGWNNKTIKLNVNYCRDCNKLFMSRIEYETYKEKYGILIGNLKFVDEDFNVPSTTSLAELSPLKLCGYNVNAASGYSGDERQYIISKILDEHIMSKSDVINYLTYFIGMNGKKTGNQNALRKWQTDLKFVQNYKIDDQEQYWVTEIKKYKS